MTDKLANTFDLPVELNAHREALASIDIPESPTLDDIARISLEVFKHSMLATKDLPAVYVPRSLEVSKAYLDLAKDAIAKNEALKQGDRKLDIGEKKVKGKDAPGAPSTGGTVSRMSLVQGQKREREAS